ncbi:hypothetical protein [Streptomyces sp. NPDC059063]|uniref:hypothetical protein n=1 Tax=Streptomyces sp. NPDC059063 TaxID=3346712 RepID=UPI0036943A27
MTTRLGEDIAYPLYEPCPPGFAESRLSPERLADLTEIYWDDAAFRRAEIALEEELRSGTFTVVTTAHPEGRTWSLEDCRIQQHNKVASDPVATTVELVDKMHFWHSCRLFFLDAEMALREEDLGRGLFSAHSQTSMWWRGGRCGGNPHPDRALEAPRLV